jgi:ACR3 family arsenite transporter
LLSEILSLHDRALYVVAINDLIIVFAPAPIVMLLVGVGGVTIPVQVLFISVFVFIVIPLAAGVLSRMTLLKLKGADWFDQPLLPLLHSITIVVLLTTLTLIFAFQAESNWTAILTCTNPA